MPKSVQTVFRTAWMPKSEPPSPAQADPIAHNPKLVTTPAKRAIAEDLIHVRMAHSPIFEP
jgi:hypothetical protein